MKLILGLMASVLNPPRGTGVPRVLTATVPRTQRSEVFDGGLYAPSELLCSRTS